MIENDELKNDELENDEWQEEELFEHHRFVAEGRQSLIRIDKYVVNLVERATRNKIQNAAKAGNILVNDTPVKSNYRVKPGDVIQVLMTYPPKDDVLHAEDIPLDIVYEDQELVLVNKNPGMVVHPGFGHQTGTLINALKFHFENLPSINAELDRPGLVHRIDKDTSGLLIIAKTEHAMAYLAKQFFDRTTKRIYNALVWGNIEEEEGTITGHIGRSLKDRKQMAVFPDGDHGRHAVTHYKVLERFRYTTLVQCKLETGRTHQIRAHFKYIGHPLFNDERYGGDQILKGTTFTKYKQFVDNCFKELPRQALHAKTLGFNHPVTKEDMYFETELPEDMKTVIDKWRVYSNALKDELES